ncbi:MAG TPA: sialidase family protein [Candidatus Thermoplasmatota archaeon]|nr:sialidase family protein [Candidatus Thermoplasmatota archaeon]
MVGSPGGRATMALAIAVAVVAAGCLGGGGGHDGPTSSQDGPGNPGASTQPGRPGTPLSFTAPVLIGGGGLPETGEASLAIGADGTLLVCALFTLGNPVWSSQDGGATWATHHPLPEPAAAATANGDCDVAIADDGTWYAVFSTTTDSGIPIVLTFASSTDRGATWTAGTVTPVPPACPVIVLFVQACWMHRPWLATVGGDVLLSYSSVIPFATFFQRSLDRGASWSDPVLVHQAGADYQLAAVGRLKAGEDGHLLYLPIHGTTAVGAAVESLDVAVSQDGGATWAAHRVAGWEGGRNDLFIPSLARGADGTAYVPVPVTNGSATDVTLRVSRDQGATWGESIVVERGIDFGATDAHVAVAADPRGGIVAGWLEWSEGGWVVRVARVEAGPNPSDPQASSATAPAGESANVEFFTLGFGPDGRLHVVYPIPEIPCSQGGRDCIYHVSGA